MSSEKIQMLAETFAGLEDVLKQELIEIGASDVETVVRGVKFSGSKAILYKANFCCRTALRVLWVIGEYKVKSTNDLYQSVYKIDWSDIFDVTQTFAITSTVNSEAFNNAMFVSLKTKDAIVDHFRGKFKKRPSVNDENPEIHINVFASCDTLTVALDSSGELLHKRGYRVGQNEASMNEVIAAGILKIAGWKGQTDFYDTMCGSGTIPIEAALIARNIPPGMFRQEFAFEKWKDFDADLLGEIYNEDYEVPFEHKIYSSDIANINIKVSEKNAKNAGVLKDIEFNVSDFAKMVPPSKSGLLIIHPPHSDRKHERQIEPMYNMIGEQLKRKYAGFNAWVFSSSEQGYRNIGLRPSQNIKINIGSIEYSYLQYELYDGSKRETKQFSRPAGKFTPRTGSGKGDFKPRERSEGFRSDRRSRPDAGGRPDRRPDGGARRPDVGSRRPDVGSRRSDEGDKRSSGGDRRPVGGGRKRIERKKD